MTYEELKYSTPKGMPKKKRKIRPITPVSAIVFFVVLMIGFSTIGAIIQYSLGAPGVAITELLFLIASVLYVKIKGHRFRDVFPIKKPKLTAFWGTLVIWFGSYLLMILVNLLVLLVNPEFPESTDVDFITGAGYPWIIMFLIIAVLPPICEEAMHRGVIQYGMKQKIKNPWIMALVIGLIFGLFHMDPSKFLATGLLGGVMGWILFQTDNMLYSSIFHFVHNGAQMVLLLFYPAAALVPGLAVNRCLTGVLAASIEEEMDLLADSQGLMYFSSGFMILVLGVIIPILLYTGNYLLIRDIAPKRVAFLPAEKKARRKQLFLIILPSVVSSVTGVICITAGLLLLME